MTFYLRKIDYKSTWDKYRYSYKDLNWIRNKEDIPSEPIIRDLKADKNSLSVFLINSDLSNLDQTLVALAANCDSTTEIDYVLIPSKNLHRRGYNIKEKSAKTPDPVANSWHRDVTEISGFRLIRLAKLILDSPQISRKPKIELKILMISSVKNGVLDKSKMKPNLLNSLGI